MFKDGESVISQQSQDQARGQRDSVALADLAAVCSFQIWQVWRD
jgi:hypothetical protein